MMEYAIYEENLERLEKKLATIQNKCSKYGCEFTYKQTGEEFRTITNENGERVTVRFVLIDAEGVAKVNGWEFVATIEHNSPVNVIRSFRTEYDVPERYYTSDPICEHCNSKRNRKDTYLIRNTETGEFKQVGKSCLKDFTNGLSAEAVVQYISWFDELIKGEAPSGSSFPVYYKVETVVQLAVEAVNLYGYQKVVSPYEEGYYRQSTKEVVIDMLSGGRYAKVHEDKGFNTNREGNAEKAAEVLRFVASMETEFGYVSNLKTLCSGEYCQSRDLGIVVSAVACYNREMARKEKQEIEKKKAAKSSWVGTVGERVTLTSAEAKLLTSWDTMYGVTHLYQFVDGSGNVYTWKTSNYVENGTVSVKGTVKAHSEFRGTKQTELTRCKVL